MRNSLKKYPADLYEMGKKDAKVIFLPYTIYEDG